MLPDLSSLGAEVLGSAAAEANSTLIGLLQVAQAAMNPRSVTRTFSRQFSKRYLARWNDKTGLKVRKGVWRKGCMGGVGWIGSGGYIRKIYVLDVLPATRTPPFIHPKKTPSPKQT